MYVLTVYDVAVTRVAKVHKCLNATCTGGRIRCSRVGLTDAQIERVKSDLNDIVNARTDSVLIYIARDEKWLKREHLGREGTTTDNLL